MDLLERIRSHIPDFAGFDDPPHRRLSDEQIRARAGEMLTSMTSSELDSLTPEQRGLRLQLLQRAEFTNQQAFKPFDEAPSPSRIEAVAQADLIVVEAVDARSLQALKAAFDARDKAMQQG
jgi:hypothetical protein